MTFQEEIATLLSELDAARADVSRLELRIAVLEGAIRTRAEMRPGEVSHLVSGTLAGPQAVACGLPLDLAQFRSPWIEQVTCPGCIEAYKRATLPVKESPDV